MVVSAVISQWSIYVRYMFIVQIHVWPVGWVIKCHTSKCTTYMQFCLVYSVGCMHVSIIYSYARANHLDVNKFQCKILFFFFHHTHLLSCYPTMTMKFSRVNYHIWSNWSWYWNDHDNHLLLKPLHLINYITI